MGRMHEEVFEAIQSARFSEERGIKGAVALTEAVGKLKVSAVDGRSVGAAARSDEQKVLVTFPRYSSPPCVTAGI